MPTRSDRRPRVRMDPDERRRLILGAARRAFAAQSYEDVSLSAIAREARASEALVHKYFSTKGRLYGRVLALAAADLAERSAALNGQEGRIQILRGDIRRIRDFPLSSRMDLVLSNPPYLKSGIRSKGEGRQIARHEILCSFRDVAVAASYLLKASGRFFLVHRAERLTDIVSDLRESGLEPKRLRMVHSRAGREAKLLLLEAVKGGRPQLHVEPPLIVYEEGGVYTEELLSLYRGEAYL